LVQCPLVVLPNLMSPAIVLRSKVVRTAILLRSMFDSTAKVMRNKVGPGVMPQR
jgi:hypothetical protein